MTSENKLGIVIGGSLSGGIDVRLDGEALVEDMAVGRYVTIQGKTKRFLGMITDVSLGVTDQRLTLTPPAADEKFLAEILSGTAAYGDLKVIPYLVLGNDEKSLLDGPQPVKTIPSHYAPVDIASNEDIEMVFGKEDASHFYVGNPLDMETRLCLNLPELVKRSNGIFGKSGTGKTFLTRTLLVGMLQKGSCVNLVFDMHSEYGWEGTSEKKHKVKALKQLFPDRVAVFTLDGESSRKRKVSVDFEVKIGYDEIEPEDISLLRQTLNLTEQAVEAVYQLRKYFKKNWIKEANNIGDEEDDKKLLDSLSIHESTFQNLKRGLNTLTRLPFIVENAPVKAVDRVLEYLNRNINVVLEFGRYTDITAYILVANLLTRRIYTSYRDRMEQAMAEDAAKPTPLVITIEEAHKFLNPEVASRTIFGTIAREMRKYNVTLLIIDQRPSGIDTEVMSQLGTKITALLDNEKDIDAVLSGISGKNELKGVLAKLASRQQALIFGAAVPMPVAFVPREYDQSIYNEVSRKKVSTEEIEELF
ncbi:hypothetical protein ASJ33_01835 [Dehalococcoides mccartyi]|jgi:hypothetical protein|uniref:helicase HerA domain-containing protein n=1 Tax=Dehalococcoides mccartyi TaxID=61435 RepID=UPI0004E0AA5D|nr:ATP-binding protein [Dehalococcoides mccartyi]AII57482.1 hypothetical protein X792_01570 [Dehalococcoides mccartyi CG1]APH11979.1 hypothetical protein ASJ33_01835 [Dehalococcoides mccartyi]